MNNKYIVHHPITKQPILILNHRLLDRQNCKENLEKIKKIHQTKILIHEEIIFTKDIKMLRAFAQDLELVEFELQKLWKFPEDARFHRFWNTPNCTCPKLDNDDNYPTGMYVTNFECRLHGGQNGN